MMFWAATGGIALIVAAILIAALRRRGETEPQGAAFDRQIYRDQLTEIERDQTRGVIAPEEAARLRSEVARRLLAADRETGKPVQAQAARGPANTLVLGVVALVLAAGFGAYAVLGTPGYRDLPLKTRIALAEQRRETRPDQAALEAALPPRPALQAADPQFLTLVEKLRDAVAKRPDDLKGHELLARNEANLGNLTAAWKAQERVIALKGSDATDDDRLKLATLMIEAAEGQVSPEAEAVLNEVLQRDPKNDTALFFGGIVNMQVGRYDLAFRYWRQLLEVAPQDSRWWPEVQARIGSLAEAAGVRYTPPDAPALAGPTAEDLKAAEDMTPEQRQQMIRGMVEGLNDRLAADGGSAEEWARLIVALANLGEQDRAKAILTEAQKTFASHAPDLARINEAATSAGLTP
ncbi:c-type cytochrome biogenesis protein CcmI [Pseudorhodobacter sp.]|uniref:c-type cytochrome biogenesis protein CcmI n=1 Tax=Pseudorhodobacter sp. TaxID=1934400 RepID=UPI00264A34D9|nr:c-type cytochrome biogenesis protein CcmI [Pseudorhodobacter sp.]MDN5788918.1 c-type cytochrome biogenesis protein CcmI [Pseudorhodobacter sp.]